MFSLPTAEDVLRDLGDKVTGGLLAATTKTRTDLGSYRDAFAHWVADHSDGGLAYWIHDRLWSHLRRELFDVDGVEFVERGPTREVYVGLHYRARVKRHDLAGKVRSYPTKEALAFWGQSDTITGLEEVRLGFGYVWRSDTREVGEPVVSLRDGLDKAAIWAVTPDRGEPGDAADISWVPVDPSLPTLDLYDDEQDNGQEQSGS